MMNADSKIYETALKKAEGLGASHSGVLTWLAQRVTAVLLLLTTGWVFLALVTGHMETYEAFCVWSHTPWNKTILLLLTAALSVHTALGLEVIVQDYIHRLFLKIWLLFLTRAVCTILFFLSLISIISF